VRRPVALAVVAGAIAVLVVLVVVGRHEGSRHARQENRKIAEIRRLVGPLDQPSLDAFKHVFNDEMKKMNVESFLGSHPDILLNMQPAMESIRDKYPTGNHPLLLSKDHANRYMDIMLECARARLAAQGRLTSTN